MESNAFATQFGSLDHCSHPRSWHQQDSLVLLESCLQVLLVVNGGEWVLGSLQEALSEVRFSRFGNFAPRSMLHLILMTPEVSGYDKAFPEFSEAQQFGFIQGRLQFLNLL